MTDLAKRRTALVAYAESCLASCDWHGLWDAAIDLAIIDARQQDRTMRLFEFDSRDVVQPWGSSLDYTTVKTGPGPAWDGPPDTIRCQGCGKDIDVRIEHACPGP